LLQKGEILNKIREDLQRVAEACEEPHTRKALQKLTRVLAEDAQLDADWEQFALHFDQVHSDFLRRLRERYPQLTPRDQKLCAYLRMNLSSKEIAPLLNISLRGVEISRYRLRRKLQMEADANLTEFLLNF
jgi:DNA-binding CsgD family transcriptional regulator